jgi:hypothetical protein
LERANLWNQIWPIIEEKINHKLEPIMKKKYENLNKKITNLEKQEEN